VSYYTNKIDDKIVSLLKSGAIGLLPTDTIYGLSAVAMKKDAVEKIHNLKKRDDKKPLIVLVSSIKQFQLLGINDSQPKAIKKYWPGPLSIEFEAKKTPLWLHRGMYYFAVRMPDNIELLELINNTGPIVSSSANLQGQKPASSVKEAEEFFGSSLDFYVDVGPLEGQPSTLAKIENNQLIVIREGAYKKHLLKK
jgi:L-threonylcarbamoyladenylate synthase